MALRGGQRRPERAGAPVRGGVGTPASHLCAFARDASRGHRVGFPALSKTCLGSARLPDWPGLPQGRRTEGRWHSAGSCGVRASERAARPAPSPPPSPAAAAAAAAHRPFLDCSARSGSSRAPSPRRSRSLAHTDTARTPSARTHTSSLLASLARLLASFSLSCSHPPPLQLPPPRAHRPGSQRGGLGVTGGRLDGSAHTHLAGRLPEAHVAGGSGSRRP